MSALAERHDSAIGQTHAAVRGCDVSAMCARTSTKDRRCDLRLTTCDLVPETTPPLLSSSSSSSATGPHKKSLRGGMVKSDRCQGQAVDAKIHSTQWPRALL